MKKSKKMCCTACARGGPCCARPRTNPDSALRTLRGVCFCTKPAVRFPPNGEAGWCRAHAPRGALTRKQLQARRRVRLNPAPRAKLLSGDKVLIRQIVGSFHVSAPDAEIEEDIRRRLARSGAPKGLVTLAVRYAVSVHHANMRLYVDVMGGRIGSPSRRRTK